MALVPSTSVGGGGGAVTAQVARVNGADYTTSSTTFGDVDATNLKLVVSPGSGALLVTFGGSVALGTAFGGVVFGVNDGATTFEMGPGILPTNTNPWGFVSLARVLIGPYITPTTLKLQWRVVGAVTATLRSVNTPQDLNFFGVAGII